MLYEVITHRLVQVIVESFVGKQLSEGSFPALSGTENIIQPGRHRAQALDRPLCILIELLILEKLARSAPAFLQSYNFV